MPIISTGPIRISTISSDRWGQPIRYWSVNDWGYVNDRRYEELLEFESPISNVLQFAKAQINKRLKMSYGQCIYQFNARHPRWEYLRMVAVMGNSDPVNRIQKIPWFDAFVKHPVYRLICWVMNCF